MKDLQIKLQGRLDEMTKTGKLFKSSLSGSEVWDLYINSFSPEDDPTFRCPETSVHNCNHCKNFIRRYGNIVAIDGEFKVMSIFDVIVDTDDEYFNTVKVLSKALKSASIGEVFYETFDELSSLPYEKCKKTNKIFRLGVAVNHKIYTPEEASKYGNTVNADKIYEFDHIHLDLPSEFVNMTGDSYEKIAAKFRTDKEVFLRSMEEISLDTLILVRDLISQGSLLNANSQLTKVKDFIKFKKKYNDLTHNQKDNWSWVTSYNLLTAKFKNELIGTFCSDLSQGVELNRAWAEWNRRVDPVNFMKAVAPITEAQKKATRKFVEDNNYLESFDRRFATLDDIKVTEIAHMNVDNDSSLKNVSIFDDIKTKSSQHKKSIFENVEEVSIEKFMKNVLPSCTSIEAFIENSHGGNFVTLTTSVNKSSKNMFNYNNNYSWTYRNNLAGKSQIKEAVKNAGGNVEGVLRASMIWNNESPMTDGSDLDIWCKQPNGVKIGFSTGYRKDSGGQYSDFGGQLDLDNQNPNNKLAIENIYFKDLNRMGDGEYLFWVNQYSANNSKGFKFEIEFDGNLFNYEYNSPLSYRKDVTVAKITLKNGVFDIVHLLEPKDIKPVEVYGLTSQKFHKVNLVCLSPNHWDGNVAGNKHYFFMLDKCRATGSIRTFHNENLNSDLKEFRKTLDSLGDLLSINPNGEKQLSGVGFNETVRDELIVKCKGSFNRILKIKF